MWSNYLLLRIVIVVGSVPMYIIILLQISLKSQRMNSKMQTHSLTCFYNGSSSFLLFLCVRVCSHSTGSTVFVVLVAFYTLIINSKKYESNFFYAVTVVSYFTELIC